MLNVFTPSEITRVYEVVGIGAVQGVAVFQANLAAVPEGCFIVGQVAVPLHTISVPVSSVFLVRPAMEGVIKPPVGYNLLWNDKGSGGSQDVTFWQVAPPAGYVALGDVAYPGYSKPPSEFTKKFACIRQDLVALGKLNDDPVWTDRGSGAEMDLSVWQVENGDKGVCGLAGFFKAQPNYSKPANEVFVLPVKVTEN